MSVADTVVTTVARRGSLGGVVQRVDQALGLAEWLVRESPGIGSQHSAVLQALPPPTMESSLPCSLTATLPPPPPAPFGLGPQASPQLFTDQDSETPLDVQVPESEGRSWAWARRGSSTSARKTASRSAPAAQSLRRDRGRLREGAADTAPG